MPRIDEIDRRTDVVFILFRFAEKIRGVTKVQKLLFLIEQETGFFQDHEDTIAFNFAPYKMGPFSEHVYEELQFLLQLDAIEAEDLQQSHAPILASELSNKEFSITQKGEKIASQLVELLEPEHRHEVQMTITEYNQKSLTELLRYVYTEYPEFAAESEIKDELFEEAQ